MNIHLNWSKSTILILDPCGTKGGVEGRTNTQLLELSMVASSLFNRGEICSDLYKIENTVDGVPSGPLEIFLAEGNKTIF
jgi:hypothetical protein